MCVVSGAWMPSTALVVSLMSLAKASIFLSLGFNVVIDFSLHTSQDFCGVVRHSSKQLLTNTQFINVNFFILELDNGQNMCPCNSMVPFGTFLGIFILIIVYHSFISIVFNSQVRRVKGVIFFIIGIVTLFTFLFTFLSTLCFRVFLTLFLFLRFLLCLFGVRRTC